MEDEEDIRLNDNRSTCSSHDSKTNLICSLGRGLKCPLPDEIRKFSGINFLNTAHTFNYNQVYTNTIV